MRFPSATSTTRREGVDPATAWQMARTYKVEKVIRTRDGGGCLLVVILVIDEAASEGLLSLRFALGGEFRVRAVDAPVIARDADGAGAAAVNVVRP